MYRNLHLQRRIGRSPKEGVKTLFGFCSSNRSRKNFVYGLNQSLLTKKGRVVSNTSCTTNCPALPPRVTSSNVSIKKVIVITFCSYTCDQPTLDRGHSDIYLAPCWVGSTWTLSKAWQRDNSYANAQCVLSIFNLFNHTRHSCRGIKRCNTIRIWRLPEKNF